jgi:hypothetical protein
MAMLRRFAPGFNNVQYQFADIELKFPGDRLFTQVTKISYSAKVAREEARGTSPLPQGVTRGALSYECSFAINRAFRDDFRIACTVPGKGIFEGFIIIVASFVHPEKVNVETDTLYIMVNEWNFDSSTGPAVLSMDIPCYCGYIEFGSGGKIIPQFADIIGVSA